MEKEPSEEEKEKVMQGRKKTAQEEIKDYTRENVLDFARSILKVLNSYTTRKEKDYLSFLEVKRENRVTLDVPFPLYQQQQACYAVNKLIEETGKIYRRTSYSEGQRTSAEYTDIEVKRNVYETLMVFGKIFFKWRKMKSIASLLFRGNYAEVNFTYAKKNRRTMAKFQSKLREFMKIHNYFKGEKLELLPYSKIRFLKYPKVSWDSLVLKEELKEEIDVNLIFPLKNRKLCEQNNIPWRRGLLLAGVPGTGKTQLGRVLCNVLEKVTLIWATSKAIHDSNTLKNLFEIARDFAPTLVVLEDIDFFGYDREFVTNPIVGELLNQLDGNAPNDGVFILATTNRPRLLDRALSDRPGRFDVKIVFETPELEERKKMVSLFSKGKIFHVEKDYIAGTTEKLTGAHIKEVINYATLLALKNGEKVVSKDHIDKALSKIRQKLERAQLNFVS